VDIPLLLYFKEKLPVLFDEIEYDHSFDPKNYAEIEVTDDLFNTILTKQ
jgi:thymidylate synthase (FAD)